MANELSASVIRKLPTPATGNKVHYDSEVKGFGLRVTAGGARSFVLNFRTRAGRERRFTIGTYPDWTATDARKEAKRLRQLIDQGGDPLASIEAEREAPTMSDLCDRFEAEHLQRKRPGTREDYKRMLAKYIRPHFGASYQGGRCGVFRYRQLAPHDHKGRASPARQHGDGGAVENVFSSRSNGRCAIPIRAVASKKTKRQNASATWWAMNWHGSPPRWPRILIKQAANIIRLLLLTGCRRGEADRCSGQTSTSPPARGQSLHRSTKQKQDHHVPLSAPVRMLLSEIAEQQRFRPKACTSFPVKAAPATASISNAIGVICAVSLASAACVSMICVTASHHS